MNTEITVVDGAVGLTPDMLRKPAQTEQAVVMSTIPTEFRGSKMESHTDWPRTWTAPDAWQAGIVAELLQNLVRQSEFPEQFNIDVHDLTVTINRRLL
jgi:hypothetical protein